MLELGLGRGERLAQLGQAVAADERREKQPVGFERAAHLHERAGQIVDELQRQRRDHEVERILPQRQRFRVGDDLPIVIVGGRAGVRRTRDRDDVRNQVGAVQPTAHRIGGRGEIDRQLEAAQHRGQPVAQILGRAVDQKRRRPELFRAAQIAAKRGAVEHDGA